MYISPIESISCDEYLEHHSDMLLPEQIIGLDVLDSAHEFMSLYDFYAQKETFKKTLYVKMGMQVLSVVEASARRKEVIGKVSQIDKHHGGMQYATHNFNFHPNGALFLPVGESNIIQGFLTPSSGEQYSQSIDSLISKISANLQ